MAGTYPGGTLRASDSNPQTAANDLKTAQHFRARLALVLRHPKGLAKPLHAELTQLFAVSGVWVRNVRDRHDTKRQIRQLIRRILPRLKV
jgi:hypothetical protein